MTGIIISIKNFVWYPKKQRYEISLSLLQFFLSFITFHKSQFCLNCKKFENSNCDNSFL